MTTMLIPLTPPRVEHDDLDVVATEERPGAVVPGGAAQGLARELAARDVRAGGCWQVLPASWRRYDRPWDGGRPGAARLLGTVHVLHGTPTRYDLLVHRASVTPDGAAGGWTPARLADDALALVGLSVVTLARAPLVPTPATVFRLP